MVITLNQKFVLVMTGQKYIPLFVNIVVKNLVGRRNKMKDNEIFAIIFIFCLVVLPGIIITIKNWGKEK